MGQELNVCKPVGFIHLRRLAQSTTGWLLLWPNVLFFRTNLQKESQRARITVPDLLLYRDVCVCVCIGVCVCVTLCLRLVRRGNAGDGAAEAERGFVGALCTRALSCAGRDVRIKLTTQD